MTVRKYSSRAQQSTLASAITSTASTMTLISGGGAKVMGGKTLTGSETYTLVIDPDTSLEEIVDVTVYSSGDTLTITRGIENSGTGVAHSAGAVVRHMATGRDLQEANNHIEASSAVHGLSGTVVGTTDSQTLSNKTIAFGSNTISGTTAQFNSALTDGDFATLAGSETLSNKTIALGSNTVSGTTAQFNTALTDGDFATLAGSETLSNKTFTTPTIASFINATHTHTDSASGGALSTSAISGIQEYVEDTVGAMVSSNTESGIAVTYDDSTGKLNFDVSDPVITLDGDITGSATMTNLGNTTITTAISSGSIVNADISASAAIDYSKLNLASSITSSDIVNGTIVNGDISSSAGIAYSKLSLNSSITSADIVDGTIVNADINASAAIALSKLATDPLARANHTGTQTASTISDFDTQVRTNKVTDLAAPTGSFSMNSQKITSLGTPTVSTDAATKGYIDTEITNLINGAPGTLDTLKEIADQIQAGGTFYDSVVFKSGSTMTGALTLHADPSSNLQAATKQYVDAVAGSATAAASSATAAAASYDSFDDRYLGAKSSAPTLDNDGNALLTGALYWNTTSNLMFVWSGSSWGSISSSAEIYRYKYVASGGETSVSGADANGSTLSYIVNKEQVYLNGVLLVRGSDYTATNGSSITSLAALTAGDILEIITFTSFEVANAVTQSNYDSGQEAQNIMSIMGAY